MFFPNQLYIAGGNKGTLARNGVKITFLLQFIIGALCCNYADAQILGERPDGGQRIIGM